jgi:hypothetical protein
LKPTEASIEVTKTTIPDTECEFSIVVLNCAYADTPYQLAIVRDMIANDLFLCHCMRVSIPYGSEQLLDRYIWQELTTPVSDDDIVCIGTGDIIQDIRSSEMVDIQYNNGLFSGRIGAMPMAKVIRALVSESSTVFARNEALRLCDKFSRSFLELQLHPRDDVSLHIPNHLLSTLPPRYTLGKFFDVLKTLYYIPTPPN